MSQFRPSQQQGVNDIQLLQQHLMYKQLQELQRQQQFPQVDHGARPQNLLLNSLPATARPALLDQLPAVWNEMPTNDSSNYMWSHNSLEGEVKTLSNSQSLVSGNVNRAQFGGPPAMNNFANGIMLSNNQIQSARSVGLVPQQLDQSFYAMPVSSSRSSPNQYSQTEKTPMQSDPFNSFQTEHHFPEHGCLQDGISYSTQNMKGKGLFGNDSMQTQITGVALGNSQQVNHLPHGVQFQEFHNMKNQGEWSGSLQEKLIPQIGPTSGATSLDPTEEKILFGTDDDDNWGASFGRSSNSSTGPYVHANPLDNDYFGGLPSLQSGSWSALMQEAVQATSSDNGVQEEWSGLNFQRSEQSIVNNSTVSADNRKMPATWEDNNLQSASALPSRPVPLFNSNDGSMNYPRFHHPSTSAYDQKERVSSESLSAPSPNQQSSGEVNNKKLYTGLKQKQSDEGSLEVRMNVSNGSWVQQTYELPESNSHPSSKLFNSQKSQGFWASPQNMPFHNVTNESSNKSNVWSTNSSLAPNGDGTSNTRSSDGSVWNVTGKNVNSISGMEQVKPDISQMQHEEYVMDKYAAMVNSNMVDVNQETNQQVINRHHVDYGKRGIFDSSIHSKAAENVERDQNQPNRIPQSWDSSGNNTDRRSGDRKQEHLNVVSNDGQILSYSDQGKHVSSGFAAKGNSSSQYDQRTMGSRMLHNHQMGSLGMSVGFSFPPNTVSNSQGLQHSIVEQSNNLEQRFLGYPQNVSNVALDRMMDARERTATGEAELKSRADIPSSGSTRSSFDGSTTLYSNSRTVQTSQNMLELLHNSDKSRNNKDVAASQVPESTVDVSATHQQHHQPSMMQGFGLRLAPPTQRQPISSQSSFHLVDSKQFDREAGDKDQTRLTSTSACHSQATLRGEELDGTSSLSEQKGEAFSSHNQVSTSSAVMLDSSYSYQQQNSGTSGHEVNESRNFTFSSQNNVNTSHAKSLHCSYDGGLSDQSAVQEGVPGLAGRVPPSRHASSSDTYPSQLHSAEMKHARPSNAGFSQIKNSGQQPPAVDTRSGSQPSIPGMHPQAGLSTMFKNVWTNISAQRLSGAQPNKITPNMLHSMILANNSRDSSLWGLRKVDDQGKKREDVSSEVGTSSTNSQNHEERQVLSNSAKQTSLDNVDVGFRRGLASQGQESFRKYSFDGSSAVPVSSLARLHQQDISRGKHGQDSIAHSQTLNTSLPNAASSSDVFHGRAMKPPDVQQHSYSLLHQMQAMKGANIDPSNRSEKRMKGADFGSDSSQMDWKTSQRFAYGQDTVLRVPVDNNAGATSHGSCSSDAQVISFNSKENEERNTALAPQPTGREVSPLSASPASNLMEGSERPKISPQMAPSWFEQYGTYRNGQNLATCDGQKVSTRQYDLSRFSGHMDKSTVMERRLDSSQAGNLGQGTASTMIISNQLPHWPSDTMENAVVMRSKKRKAVVSKPLSWHKVIEGPQKLQSIRVGELDWAQASNRLIEKLEDEAEMQEDGPSIAPSRRRLIITTQLTQQLIPAVPAAILKEEAASSYESLTYNVAKLTLGDACSLISCLESKSCLHADDDNLASEGTRSPEKVSDHFFSKAMEDFVGRSKNLENDFIRLDKRTSMLDVRLECQELERFSIVNRLGKFHGRNHTEGVEGSASESAPRRTFPQRYVTALPMAGNLPEGVLCFSL
ncbi:uncharacterized protein [Typha angustifolia]|uniref:uncharacterized protein n=1 Tax=Typha angustifolia TaxID=59011 RepID=UPI003C2C1195